VTDNEGCSQKLVFTGQTAHCNGSPAAIASEEVTVAKNAAKACEDQREAKSNAFGTCVSRRRSTVKGP